MQVEYLFETPLIFTEIPNAAELNRALRAAIDQRIRPGRDLVVRDDEDQFMPHACSIAWHRSQSFRLASLFSR